MISVYGLRCSFSDRTVLSLEPSVENMALEEVNIGLYIRWFPIYLMWRVVHLTKFAKCFGLSRGDALMSRLQQTRYGSWKIPDWCLTTWYIQLLKCKSICAFQSFVCNIRYNCGLAHRSCYLGTLDLASPIQIDINTTVLLFVMYMFIWPMEF